MNKSIEERITGASSVAVATNGPHGIKVVPLSVWRIIGEEIFLYDFFMRKTVENIKSDSEVAITFSREFVGVQVKAEAVYETEGPAYEMAVTDMKKQFPDRTLKGVIRLKPKEVYDVAPGASPENILK